MGIFMYDVVIVGSGIVGLVHALLLAQQTNLNIAIVSAQDINSEWSITHYDNRVYAIVPYVQGILSSLGIWQNLVKQRVGFIKNMVIWDLASTACLNISQRELNVEALAYVVEDNLLYNYLSQALHQYQQISWFIPWNFQNFTHQSDGLLINCAEGVLKTRLLVGADGGDSVVRKAANIEVETRSYNHSALITQVVTEVPHNNCAQQFFLNKLNGIPNGPLAFLPLYGQYHSAIVWSMHPDDAQNIMSIPDVDWSSILTQASLNKFGQIQSVGARQLFPLYERNVANYVQDRLALIGDAAHTIHPLAGQGLNLGIADAASLAQVIINFLRKNRKFYSYASLRRYERDRRPQNLIMLYMIFFLKIIFADQQLLTTYLRYSGLTCLKYFSILKSSIVFYAMGKK